jgi:hypothetical protein
VVLLAVGVLGREEVVVLLVVVCVSAWHRLVILWVLAEFESSRILCCKGWTLIDDYFRLLSHNNTHLQIGLHKLLLPLS